MTAELGEEFVVFRIGMRINSLWKLHQWLPVFRAMPRMLDELDADSERGLLAWDLKPGFRVQEVVQYWRSFEDLREYALDGDAEHAPAMRWANELLDETDAVGIWHETYVISSGEYETVYENTPPIGLAKAGELRPATDQRRTAAGRLGVTKGGEIEADGVRSAAAERS
ncbi:DUF4188 domain-containing protein [Salinirubellus sp. GCM10025818]